MTSFDSTVTISHLSSNAPSSLAGKRLRIWFRIRTPAGWVGADLSGAWAAVWIDVVAITSQKAIREGWVRFQKPNGRKLPLDGGAELGLQIMNPGRFTPNSAGLAF